MPSKLQIEPGTKFNDWTVIEEREGQLFKSKDKEKGQVGRTFLCRCLCGEEKTILLQHLRKGASKRCLSCSLRNRAVPAEIGSTYNKWTIIEDNDKSKPFSGDRKVLCRCECGTTKLVIYKCLLNEKSTKCELCRNKYRDCGVHSTTWLKILRNAAMRDIEVNISPNEVYDILVAQEFRCKLTNLPIEEKVSASLDRIDNSLGYITGNVQWLHKDVNIMKNIHSQEYFISICKAVAENSK